LDFAATSCQNRLPVQGLQVVAAQTRLDLPVGGSAKAEVTRISTRSILKVKLDVMLQHPISITQFED
jgi:hypothetical protein